MKREKREERQRNVGTRRIVKIVRDEHVHLFPYLFSSPPRSSPFRRNGSPTCNQNRDRKLPMNFFSSPLFHTFFLPFSFAFSKTIGYLTGYLLPISFAHGVSNVIVAKNVLQLELKYPARDGFRFVFDRLFRLLDNFISVPSFCSPSLSLSPFPPPLSPHSRQQTPRLLFPVD